MSGDQHGDQHEEQQYLDLLHDVLTNGHHRQTRNASVKSVFGRTLSFDLQQGFPLLTTKKMAFRLIVSELAWFLRGSVDIRELQEENNHIWDANADENNELGPIYGFQWRHFGARYRRNYTSIYDFPGVDQITNLIHSLRNDPHSRRHILTAWNPQQLSQMALPPCHVLYQYYVHDGKISCQLYQRSSDLFLGLPFNIASSALLVHLLASETDLSVGTLHICIGDAHVYDIHEEAVLKQLERSLFPFPRVRINREKDGLWGVKFDEIELLGYSCHGKLSAPMVA